MVVPSESAPIRKFLISKKLNDGRRPPCEAAEYPCAGGGAEGEGIFLERGTD